MKRILMSAGVLTIMGVGLYLGSTGAFFSDTETSTGNIFTAGDIDLQIDNESYALDFNIPDFPGTPTGALVENPANSWILTDLIAGTHRFFDFEDVKPGDYGEDTISIHVGSNDAWMCAAARITSDIDVTYTEPETADDTTDGGDPMVTDGELDDVIQFAFWADDGDNVYEPNGNGGETIFLEGPLSGLGEAGQIALASPSGGAFGNNPVPGNSTSFIGKMWCAGTLTPTGLTQDGSSEARSPLTGTGFTCDGSAVNNAAQTDSVEGDMQFYAVQARNNPNFSCTTDYTPVWPEEEPNGELVGALSSSYDDPATCDFTVTDAESIQADINTAVAGNTICVDSSYTGAGDTFPINVDKDLTIAGLGAMGAANIPGGFFIDASGVTITGLEFTDYDFMGASNNAAIYIHNEAGQGSGTALTGTTISHNIFTAPGDAIAADAKAIMTEIGSGAVFANAIEIAHNVITGWNQGIYFNTANANVHHNDIYSNNVGIANDGPHTTSIHHNDFESNIAEAVGVDPSAKAGATTNGVLMVNTNNLTPVGGGNNVNWYGVSQIGGADVDATNNYFAGEAEAARTNVPAEVDTEPVAAVAYPEN